MFVSHNLQERLTRVSGMRVALVCDADNMSNLYLFTVVVCGFPRAGT